MIRTHHIIPLIIALLIGSAFFHGTRAQDLLPRSTPETQGLSSLHIQEFFDTLMQDSRTEVHSCIVMRHGHVVAEMYPHPWRKDYRHTTYSISKTFTSLAVGMCLADSLIALTDTIGKFLSIPPHASQGIRTITVRDLLTMQSGIPVDTKMRIHETQWLHAYLSKKPTSAPGTRWAYDSIMSYLLSAIVQKVTGQTLMDLLQERLFHTLGITDALWEESPEGITCGGWGLYIRPETMPMLGQLLLNKGTWMGKEIVPSWWVEEMMKPQTSNGRYSYHIWQTQYPGWAEANGANGQYIFIIPEADMVVSLMQCTGKSAPVKEWIKAMLVDNCLADTLPPSHTQISFSDYTLPLANGEKAPSTHPYGTWHTLGKNPLNWQRLSLSNNADTLFVHIQDTQEKTYTIALGHGQWIESEFNALPYYNPPFQGNFCNLPTTWHVSGSYGWTDATTLNIQLHWTDWLTSASLQVHFLPQGPPTITITPHDTGKKVQILTK